MVLPGCSDCFVARTSIDTPRGRVPIEELEVGDVVWSFSIESRRRVARSVRCTLRRRARQVRSIRAGEAFVRGVTTEHPFYDPARGVFRPVRDLVSGDLLAAFDPMGLRACPIESVTAFEVPEPRIEVFNLTIDGPEANYFAEGFLVHNKSPSVRACPDGTVTIAPHAAPDASAEPVGDFDVTVRKVSDVTRTFSILIKREGDNLGAPPQVVEKLSEQLYRARLLNPGPGNYNISAFGYVGESGPDTCTLLGVRRDFTIERSQPDAGAGD
jgi:hypothetical protein